MIKSQTCVGRDGPPGILVGVLASALCACVHSRGVAHAGLRPLLVATVSDAAFGSAALEAFRRKIAVDVVLGTIREVTLTDQSPSLLAASIDDLAPDIVVTTQESNDLAATRRASRSDAIWVSPTASSSVAAASKVLSIAARGEVSGEIAGRFAAELHARRAAVLAAASVGEREDIAVGFADGLIKRGSELINFSSVDDLTNSAPETAALLQGGTDLLLVIGSTCPSADKLLGSINIPVLFICQSVDKDEAETNVDSYWLGDVLPEDLSSRGTVFTASRYRAFGSDLGVLVEEVARQSSREKGEMRRILEISETELETGYPPFKLFCHEHSMFAVKLTPKRGHARRIYE
jgi:hypothetical protein